MRAKILIIEDNPLNMELASDLLEKEGYLVLKADEAEDGIVLARKEQPDLILMDISLPGMDGLTAIKIIKQEPATSGITIVALTAHAMKGDEEKARAAGCAGYLTKPIQTRTFAQQVASFLNAQQ